MSETLASLRICFVVGTLGVGGAERQLYYMLSALQSNGIECCVLCLTQGEHYESKIQNLGIPVVWVGQSANRLKRLWRIVSEIKQWKPHIIQSSHSYTSPYVAVAGYLTKLPAIGAFRSHGIGEFHDLGVIGRLALRLTPFLIGNSEAALQSIATQYPNKSIYLLKNVVDTRQFRPTPTSKSESIIHLLSVGRLIELKRQDLILQVVAELHRDGLPIRARIVGEGPLHSELEKLASTLGVSEWVEFTGLRQDMVDIYNEADIFISTSDYEGTPNVLLEAMACGLPVVATRAGGSADVVREGETGYLVPIGDVKNLRECVQKLVEDELSRKQMGREAREHIVDSFSLNRLYNDMMAIYKSILAASGQRRTRRQ